MTDFCNIYQSSVKNIYCCFGIYHKIVVVKLHILHLLQCIK